MGDLVLQRLVVVLLLYRIYIAPFSYKSARSKALYIRTFDVSQIRIHFATQFQKKSIKATQLYYKTTLLYLYYKYYVLKNMHSNPRLERSTRHYKTTLCV